MDSRLLRECEIARDELRKGKKDMVTARAEFEESLRRLYIGGASLGKIGEALGLSRQRIHQIIGAVPRPAEQRAFGFGYKPSSSCSFCGKGGKFVGKLFAGSDAHICSECIGVASGLLEDKASKSEAQFSRLPSSSRKPCSFCGQRKPDLPRIAAHDHQICRNCLSLLTDLAAAPAD